MRAAKIFPIALVLLSGCKKEIPQPTNVEDLMQTLGRMSLQMKPGKYQATGTTQDDRNIAGAEAAEPVPVSNVEVCMTKESLTDGSLLGLKMFTNENCLIKESNFGESEYDFDMACKLNNINISVKAKGEVHETWQKIRTEMARKSASYPDKDRTVTMDITSTRIGDCAA